MAVANLNLPSFPSFDVTEKDTLLLRWKKYIKRFKSLCSAVGVVDDGQQVAMLVTYIGDEMYDIYENIITAATPAFNDVVTAFETHFAPTVNPAYETYVFRQIRQNPEESIHQFYIRLKEQGQKCDFHNLEHEIKQQIELTTNNNKLRRYSFQHQTKTLQELLTTGKSFEDMKIYTETVEKQESTPVNAITRKNTQYKQQFKGKKFGRGGMSNNKKCYRCDGEYPHQKICPAIGKVCNKCQKKDHFSKCCKTKNLSTEPKHRHRQQYNNQPLNQITHSTPIFSNCDNDNSDDCDYLFAIRDLYDLSTDLSKKEKVFECAENFVSTVKIASQSVAVLVDTGASVNILNKRTFDEINNRTKNSLKLTKTKTRVCTYGKDDPPLKILGEVETLVETKSKFTDSKFYIVDTKNINLLSGVTALALDMIIITKDEEKVNTCSAQDQVATKNPTGDSNLSSNLDANRENNIPTHLSHLINKFKKTVFTNRIGKIKNYKVKLHINPAVPQLLSERDGSPSLYEIK